MHGRTWKTFETECSTWCVVEGQNLGKFNTEHVLGSLCPSDKGQLKNAEHKSSLNLLLTNIE